MGQDRIGMGQDRKIDGQIDRQDRQDGQDRQDSQDRQIKQIRQIRQVRQIRQITQIRQTDKQIRLDKIGYDQMDGLGISLHKIRQILRQIDRYIHTYLHTSIHPYIHQPTADWDHFLISRGACCPLDVAWEQTAQWLEDQIPPGPTIDGHYVCLCLSIYLSIYVPI